MIAFLDTHAFVLLGEARTDRFGADSRRLLVQADLCVSPAVLLELHFLFEIGRLAKGDPGGFHAAVLRDCDVRESPDPFADVVRHAAALTWTRDPFDRLIVGAAALHRAKLITKDANIHEHFAGAVW